MKKSNAERRRLAARRRAIRSWLDDYEVTALNRLDVRDATLIEWTWRALKRHEGA
jgi:hypothetical protein